MFKMFKSTFLIATMFLLFGGGILFLFSHISVETTERQAVGTSSIAPTEIFDGVVTGQLMIDYRNSQKTIVQQAKLQKSSVVREKLVEGSIVDKKGRIFKKHRYELTALPNDPEANQWWVSQIGMEAIWDKGSGSHQTAIAIIDSGFHLEHEELTGRWQLNQDEMGFTTSENPSRLNCTDQGIPLDKSCNLIDDDFDGIVDNESGPTTRENPSRLNCTDQGLPLDKSCNLIDDDDNGLVDDWRGFDFANFDAFVESGETNPSGEAVHHGTAVAAVAAATGNNSKGIAGVDWNVKLLPIQVFTDEGYADTLILSRAVRYATDRGVDIINLSLGTPSYDAYLREAIRYAIEAGVLVVAATGNNGCNCMLYPARFAEVVAVGSSDSTGSRSSLSNYGPNLDLLAPGSSIRTARWSATSNSSYTTASGTSLATPLASGILSIVRSWNPHATWAEVIAIVLENTNREKIPEGQSFSITYGFGVVDGEALVSRLNTAYNFEQLNQFSPLIVENQLGSSRAYQCAPNQFGATSLYELNKDGRYYYTVNELENFNRVNNNWTSRFLGYSCLALPEDSASVIRSINLGAEFSNIGPKSIE